MAERVEIRGGELDGSVLENAATEATLLRLVESFEKKNGPGSGNKLQDLYNKSLKQTIKSTDALAESFEKTKTIVDSMGSALFSLVTKPLSAVVSGATFAVQSITDLLLSSFKNYQGIADVGATFGNNMIEVSRTALNAGMGLAEFTEMIQQNSDVLTALGGSASQGARRLASLRDEIVKGDIGARLYGLGLTTKDIVDYMGTYLDQQQRLGSFQRRSDTNLIKSTQIYIEELDKVTKLTGIQRKQLDEQARKIAIDPVFNALRRGLNPEQLAKSSANLAAAAEIGGQEFQDAIKEIATGVVQSPLAQQLQASGALTQETAKAIAKGTMDIIPVMQRALGIIDGIAVFSNDTLIAADENIRAVAQFRDRANRIREADFQSSIEEQKQRDKLTEAFGRIPALFDNIRNKIFGTLVSSEIFDKLASLIEVAADKLGEFLESLEKYIQPVANYFGNLIDDLTKKASSDGLIAALKEGISRLMTDFRTIVVPEFNKLMKELFGTDDIGKSLKTFLVNGFKSLISGVLGYDENMDIGEIMKTLLYDGFKALFTGIFNLLSNNLDKVAAGLVGIIIASFLGILSGPFIAIGAALFGIFGYEKIKEWVGIGADAIADLGTSIAEFFSWESMKGFFSDAWDAITGVPSTILEYFSLESAGRFFSDAWDAITGVPNKIIEYFNLDLAGEFFSHAWNTITGVPSKILEYFSLDTVRETFSNAWNAITGVPTKILEYFNLDDLELPSITDMFNGLVEKIKNFFAIDIDFGGFADYLPTWLGGSDAPVASGMTPRESAASSSTLRQDFQGNTVTTSATTAATAAATLPDINVSLENMQTALNGIVGSFVNASKEQSRQLNTLLEQSIALNTQQLEATQDLLRAIKGSYSPV